jgi:ATP-dependent DNA helicase RecQ
LNPDEIALSKTFYSQRKQEAFAMLESIIHYATSETECRSRMLVTYFGEKKPEDCGVCDVCLKKRRNALSQNQFGEIEKQILALLAIKSHTITDIVTHLRGWKENEVLSVLRWQIEEGLIETEGEMVSAL